ncbi:MAG: hypothetical protein GX444_04435 [Myxococcales bacterium]|nr:hypothetical protein [Myxococcales bacterium]
MKKWWNIVLLAAMLAAAVAPATAGSLNPTAELRGYDVALVNLQTPVKIATAEGRQKEYRQAYLVRLHGSFPADGAELMRLALGDQPIPEYGGLPDGIYFMVFETAALNKLAGREFRFQYGSQEWRSSGVHFEPSRFAPFMAMPEEQAFKRPFGEK